MNAASFPDQAWFELTDRKRRGFSSGVWIPLWSWIETVEGEQGRPSFREEFVGVRTAAVHESSRDGGELIEWSHLAHSQNGVYASGEGYKPAEAVSGRTDLDEVGIALVLEQGFDGAEPSEWHLNQDLVFALGLLREGDKWLSVRDGYEEVVRLLRTAKGKPNSFEIRSEYLRDYLAARRMSLRIVTYFSREAVFEEPPSISWASDQVTEDNSNSRFEGRITEIHEGGMPFGSEIAVFRMSRTDVDPSDDVPVFSHPTEATVAGESWIARRSGRKLYSVSGEMWRDEWVEPGASSPRVRGDKLPSMCSYIVDAAGNRASSDDLKTGYVNRYLWFRPDVIAEIAARRGGQLGWYTRNTGGIDLVPSSSMHFGINEIGLVNVFAKDLAGLPEWQQRIWMGANVAPDGKVSTELLDSQQRTEPARTVAPEVAFLKGLDELDAAFELKWGCRLLMPHAEAWEIRRRIHRFRVVAPGGLLSLAKDIARLTADSIDAGALQKIVTPPKTEKWRGLKSLEKVLATISSDKEARTLVGRLVGIYDLRLGDAHLPSSALKDAFALAGVSSTGTKYEQSMELLDAAADSIAKILEQVTKSSEVG